MKIQRLNFLFMSKKWKAAHNERWKCHVRETTKSLLHARV
jgi:hypothetical protein